MYIDGLIPDVDGFKQRFNNFLTELIEAYRDVDPDIAFGLSQFLTIRELPANREYAGVRLQLRKMDGPAGELVLDCSNDELEPHLGRLGLEYLARWGRSSFVAHDNSEAEEQPMAPQGSGLSHKGGGRHRSKCNAWAIEHFDQGKTIPDIQEEYAAKYNAEKPNNSTPPAKELARIYREWKEARNG